jgi:hypothetical protein
VGVSSTQRIDAKAVGVHCNHTQPPDGRMSPSGADDETRAAIATGRPDGGRWRGGEHGDAGSSLPAAGRTDNGGPGKKGRTGENRKNCYRRLGSRSGPDGGREGASEGRRGRTRGGGMGGCGRGEEAERDRRVEGRSAGQTRPSLRRWPRAASRTVIGLAKPCDGP